MHTDCLLILVWSEAFEVNLVNFELPIITYLRNLMRDFNVSCLWKCIENEQFYWSSIKCSSNEGNTLITIIENNTLFKKKVRITTTHNTCSWVLRIALSLEEFAAKTCYFSDWPTWNGFVCLWQRVCAALVHSALCMAELVDLAIVLFSGFHSSSIPLHACSCKWNDLRILNNMFYVDFLHLMIDKKK